GLPPVPVLPRPDRPGPAPRVRAAAAVAAAFRRVGRVFEVPPNRVRGWWDFEDSSHPTKLAETTRPRAGGCLGMGKVISPGTDRLDRLGRLDRLDRPATRRDCSPPHWRDPCPVTWRSIWTRRGCSWRPGPS